MLVTLENMKSCLVEQWNQGRGTLSLFHVEQWQKTACNMSVLQAWNNVKLP